MLLFRGVHGNGIRTTENTPQSEDVSGYLFSVEGMAGDGNNPT
jgi:hypothetical protein